MARNSYKLILVCMLAFLLWLPLFPLTARADSITSSLNGKILELAETPQEYSFLVVGHVYGSSGYPAPSFLANVNRFNAVDAQFFVLLGDIISSSTELKINRFKYSVGDNLDMPIFNAPGNHDVEDRDLYTRHFGRTFFSFIYSTELYIFLDSELNNAQIEGEQLKFILNSLDKAGHSDGIKNVFIFSHRLLWAIDNEPIDTIIPWVNGPSAHPETATSFKEYILPKLFTLSDNKHIYLMSGDIGAKHSLPLFYQKDPKRNITYVACGLGEPERDATIKVDITREGEVTFIPISLTDKELEDISHYGIDYWANYFGAQEDQQVSIFQLLWIKIHSVLTSIVFYLGIAFSFTLIGIAIGGLILFKKVRKP